MGDAKKISIFRNGRNQAIRIPKDMELPEGEAYISREGRKLIIEPVEPTTLLELLTTLDPLDEELPEIIDSPPDAVDVPQ